MIVNVLVGLATSLIGGACVWLWERGQRSRALRRKADFFGVVPGEPCLIVIGSKHNLPNVTAGKDVRALIEVATLASQLGSDVVTESSNEFRGSNDGRTEFCIGGPLGGANTRTGGHLTAHLPGIAILPYSEGPESAAFVVGGQRYLFEPDSQEYALVAKFTPPTATRPIFLICGQSSLANQAAIHFLKRNHRNVARSLASVDRFCILIKVSDIGTYGFQAAALERDVTGDAFARA
ncbi:hypothetical protein AVL59_21230 [Streptomyces griseochromogenes]|uniref:Secreted protein n=1 Tax=Streptomyces griseochromogenes TaxID=68214 RepID=A0A1B1BCW0_9ACTN|nr:hypothetical protein AVL59_21230 [Streptomyces griseochromogenes]